MTSGTSWGGESTPSLFLMRTNFPFLCPGRGVLGKDLFLIKIINVSKFI